MLVFNLFVLSLFSSGIAHYEDEFAAHSHLEPEDPSEIDTQFTLFTPKDPENNLTFRLGNFSESDVKGLFDMYIPKAKTIIYVKPFLSEKLQDYELILKSVILKSEKCNVIIVGWNDALGHDYSQTVANGKVVGAEIGKFVELLQDFFGIKPQSVHIIGYSLGCHIAGFVGKNIKNLGRITALDPAGPRFRNVDPADRLDRTDALFVDVIHTNAANISLEGYGLAESIGHFDFYANGGEYQPGCPYLSEGVWGFFKSPSIHKIKHAVEDIICSHRRSVYLFMTSMLDSDCDLMGAMCESYEKFKAGECGSCENGSAACVELGIRAERYSKYINNNRSIDFHFDTTDKFPFCK